MSASAPSSSPSISGRSDLSIDMRRRPTLTCARWKSGPTCVRDAHRLAFNMKASDSLPDILRFVHLSDIHVRSGSEAVDPNADIRRQLRHDLARLTPQLGPFTGVLVCGDIAFSGQAAEYARAKEWLIQIAETIKVPPEDIWMVPGNHDVDIGAESDEFREIQAELRGCDSHAVARRLQAVLDDSAKASHVFVRLRNYNDFAAGFGCQVSAAAPYWTGRWDIANGGVVLLRGISSPLISGLTDSEDANRLVVGEFQVQLDTTQPAIQLAMCHHPPPWLRDWEDVEIFLDARSSVQLFGHRHVANQQIRNRSLRISSGAVHPERGEGWQPRYNILELEKIDHGEGQAVEVTLMQRVWDRRDTKFTGTKEEKEVWRLPLDSPERPSPREEPSAERVQIALNAPEEAYVMVGDETTEQGPSVTLANRGRRLVYELSNLDPMTQGTIGIELGILNRDERNLPTRQLVPLILSRANEAGKLGDLWDQVSIQRGEVSTLNPFTS
jgi:hypothetical protein